MADEMEGGPKPSAPKRHPRRQMIQFFAVFVTIVLGLLIGYRYAIDTLTNDWYLFHVAKHTAWCLDKVGAEAQLEDTSVGGWGAAEHRATLAAWDRGENLPSEVEIAATSREPLSAWESFRYRVGRQQGTHDPAEIRALMKAWERGASAPSEEEIAAEPSSPLTFKERYAYRRARTSREGRGTGPRVWFVLNAGLETEVRTLTAQARELRDSVEPGQAAPAEAAQLDARVAELQEKIQAARQSKEPDSAVLGRYFVFVVVPECGAIEVMAIYLAAIVAFPTRWWKRLLGILLGLPIMYFVNVFRLTCLGVVGALDTTTDRWVFNFAHEYVWQTVYIIFVVAVWLLWTEYVVRRGD